MHAERGGERGRAGVCERMAVELEEREGGGRAGASHPRLCGARVYAIDAAIGVKGAMNVDRG